MSHWHGQRSATTEEMLEYLRTHVRIDRDTGCHRWAGVMNGRRPYVKWLGRNQDARRLLVTLAGRALTRKLCVWTSCAEPDCMNEAHIRVGTYKQAAQAAARRGAYLSGTARSVASLAGRTRGGVVLPLEERPNILRMQLEGRTLQQIADQYGCSKPNVWARLRTWERTLGPLTLIPSHHANIEHHAITESDSQPADHRR